MPVYRMNVVVRYTARRADSGDIQNAILYAIETSPYVRSVSNDAGAEEVDTPTQPDKDGQ
jgi:hypothetical protein